MAQPSHKGPMGLVFFSSRPILIFAGAITYSLGAGIVHYLGGEIDWNNYWIGQLVIIFLQLSGYLLLAFFDFQAVDTDRKKMAENDQGKQIIRRVFLQSGLLCLSMSVVFLVILINQKGISGPLWIILGSSFFLSLLYAVPPVSLARSGYGELFQSILIANLIPAISFLLQMGELHRLLLMLTFPLTAIYLATQIAFLFPRYKKDMAMLYPSLIVRMGWQQAITFHHQLIILAYSLIAIGGLMGLPWKFIWPVLCTIPVGGLQIWLLSQIKSGSKPKWQLLKLTSGALAGLTTYLIVLTLWTS